VIPHPRSWFTLTGFKRGLKPISSFEMHISAFLVLGLVANVLATPTPAAHIEKRNAQDIMDALGSVKTSVDALDTAVNAVPNNSTTPDLTSLANVATMAGKVGDTIKAAMTKIQNTGTVSLIGALPIQGSATALSDSVTTVTGDLVKKRAPVKAAGLSQVVGQMLQMQKAMSGGLSMAVTAKLPSLAAGLAGNTANSINQSFDTAIKAFMADAASMNGTAPAVAAPPPARARSIVADPLSGLLTVR
jgi:hypothetical protein